MRARKAQAWAIVLLAAFIAPGGSAMAHHEPPPIAQILAGPVAAGGGPFGIAVLWGSRSSSDTEVVYFIPKDSTTPRLSTATITASLNSVVDWFRAQFGRRPLIDTSHVHTVEGLLAASSYRDAASESYLTKISQELASRGFSDPNKRYLLYAAVPSKQICGEAYLPPAPAFAALYIDAVPSACGGRDFGSGTWSTAGRAETILAQEWLHNEGIVPSTAPHDCAFAIAHVCTGPLGLVARLDPEELDVMFPYVTGPLRDKVLDRGHDDYFQQVLSSTSFVTG